MRRVRLVLVLLAALAVVLRPSVSAERRPLAAPQSRPTIAQYLKPGLPSELVSAKKVDRIAWIAYEEGKRNVFTAVGPTFRPVRVTSFLKDDGVDLTAVRISDDGSVVAFVRGSTPNNQGWVANPAGDPAGGERAIWAARTATPGVAWRLAEGNNPEVAPDGKSVLYMKDGQIYRAKVGPGPAATPVDKGEKPFINAWGRNSGPRWSPDGSKIAFSTNRTDHSFIGLYDVKTHLVSYVAPSVDRDTSPTWSADGKRLAFLRRPGLPFGQQATPGSGSGLPDVAAGGRGGNAAAAAPSGRAGAPGGATGRVGGAAGAPGAAVAPGSAAPGQTPPPPAAVPPAGTTPPGGAAAAQAAAGRQGGAGRGGRAGGGGGGGGGGVQAPPGAANAQQPGLYRAALPGGNTLALMVADMATGDAKEVWHPGPNDATFGNINTITWAGDSVLFTMPQQGDEESPRYHSLSLSGTSSPVRLNTTEGLVEDATAVTLSKDGKMFYYCTNATDIDRRHIWAVPTSGGTPTQITTGEGIENVPVVLASGKQIAVLSADAKRPMSVGIWPATRSQPSAQKVIYPVLGPDFPMAQEVEPTNVLLKAEDGREFHNQLFLPKDIKPGEKRPALIFVHGGPQRQMLLGWHYLSFYHVFYGVNQWLTSQGYIVLSVNYRSGVGYGRQFRQAPETGARGNSEYRDVLAAGKWLAARPDVDSNRVGIWGLSYGGLLTAEALARNSDIFKAGVDLAGVHLEGSSLDPESVSYKASSISEIEKWKSPVLLFQGDDDRNVNFAQMVGLVQLLRAHNVYHELIVFPDDVHETLLHKRWLYTFARMETFLTKFLGENAATRSGGK
jgi:dipeptidyl aminopeptidase/acylaminoacyl peptidase